MLSIIVLSSDGYSDCWEPMFKSLKTYISDIGNYELLLSTNSKSYSYPGLNIKSLHNGDDSFSKRVKKSLEIAKNDIVLLIIEDFFLRSKLDNILLKELVYLMKSEKNIDHIRLLCSSNKYKTEPSAYAKLDNITEKTNHRFLYLPGLWKKEILQKYIVNFESPYMAEKMANQRSYIFKDGFYSISQEYIKEHGQFFNSGSSGAVYKGKWADWVREFFERLEINLDLNKRGFGSKEYNEMIRKKTLISLLKTPILTLRSAFNIIGLYVKVNFFRIK